MEYFTKITTDEHNDLWVNYLLKDKLALKVLILITMRVRSSESKVLGLKKGEFVFSRAEYKKFGLKKNEQDKLRRVIKNLENFQIIKKTTNRTTNNAIVYKYIDNDFADCSRLRTTNKTTNGQPTGNQRATNGQPGTKNDKNDKNDNVEKKFNEFWELYPRKKAKAKAKEKFIDLIKKNYSLADLMIDGLKKQLPEMQNKEPAFIPHPTTWLNQGRWDDDIDSLEKKNEGRNKGWTNLADMEISF